MPINYYIFLSLALFCIGMVGVLTRRNAIIIFMCIELMLNAVNLLLVAFSKMPQHVATIRNWTTTDQIVQFCTSISAVTSLYFIVDQWNSLDDDAYNSGGARAKSLVLEMTFKHYLIMGSSANSRSIKELEARQDSIKKYTVYGGMTQVCNLF